MDLLRDDRPNGPTELAAGSRLSTLPILTDVVEAQVAELSAEAVARVPSHVQLPDDLAAQLDGWLLDQLPVLIREVVAEMTPKLEQQLLDALMPRLLASLSQWQGDMD